MHFSQLPLESNDNFFERPRRTKKTRVIQHKIFLILSTKTLSKYFQFSLFRDQCILTLFNDAVLNVEVRLYKVT
jgi:hypothetical protein